MRLLTEFPSKVLPNMSPTSGSLKHVSAAGSRAPTHTSYIKCKQAHVDSGNDKYYFSFPRPPIHEHMMRSGTPVSPFQIPEKNSVVFFPFFRRGEPGSVWEAGGEATDARGGLLPCESERRLGAY